MDQDELCPSGSEITEAEDCIDALRFAGALGITLQARNNLVSGNWNHVPSGCSYQAVGDQAFHFNLNDSSNGLHQYKMICKQGKIVKYLLYPISKSKNKIPKCIERLLGNP